MVQRKRSFSALNNVKLVDYSQAIWDDQKLTQWQEVIIQNDYVHQGLPWREAMQTTYRDVPAKTIN